MKNKIKYALVIPSAYLFIFLFLLSNVLAVSTLVVGGGSTTNVFNYNSNLSGTGTAGNISYWTNATGDSGIVMDAFTQDVLVI